jgi:effector-binding domain-containing protein
VKRVWGLGTVKAAVVLLEAGMNERRDLAADPAVCDAEVVGRESVHLIGIRDTVALKALHSYPLQTLPVIAAVLRHNEVWPAGPATALFRPREAGAFEVTAGYPTATRLELGQPFTCDRLPAGPAVQAMHVGPWDTLLSTYDRLNEWLAVHRVPFVPLMWEEYVVGPELVADPTTWRTRIVVPLPPRGGGGMASW